MKLYFAGAESDSLLCLLEEQKVHHIFVILWEKYASGDFPDFLNYGINDVFLDSGSQDAFKKGITIDPEQYASFLSQYNIHFEAKGNLDVIGDIVASAKNRKFLESRGHKVIPTFHQDSGYTKLRALIRKHDYIALRPAQKTSKKHLVKWLDGCFSIIQDKTKVHGYNMSSFDLLKRYPFYSVETSAWIQDQKFGNIIEFDPSSRKGMKKFYYKDAEDIKEFGSVEFCGSTDETQWKKRSLLCIGEYLKMEQYINTLWEKRGITWE